MEEINEALAWVGQAVNGSDEAKGAWIVAGAMGALGLGVLRWIRGRAIPPSSSTITAKLPAGVSADIRVVGKP